MELSLTKIPIAKAELLIRKPANDVYEAFSNPAITTKFWFTRSSGKLEADKRIRWDWEMYGAPTIVVVKVLEPGNFFARNPRAHYRLPTTIATLRIRTALDDMRLLGNLVKEQVVQP